MIDYLMTGDLIASSLVLSADDRNCKTYFNYISKELQRNGVKTNDINADKYSISDFSIKDRVTLSTIHKAKGNEAYCVYIVGCDALAHNPDIRSRNLLFTAMTRTKGWLTLSGIGKDVKSLFSEIEKAKENSPRIIFKYPTKSQSQRINQDISIAEKFDDKKIQDISAIVEEFGGLENFTKYLQQHKKSKVIKK